MKSKIGVAYNVFDGEELLRYSIESIKDTVDYIVVVVQITSNMGEDYSSSLQLCREFLQEGLIHNLHIYQPDVTIDPHLNETNKRNIGLDYCRSNGCTHFLTLDVDEVYIPHEFASATQKVIESDIDASVCRMYTYYRQFDTIVDPPEDYYVPFIYKVKEDNKFEYAINFPKIIDPTRRIQSHTVGEFPIEKFAMHHLSYIRNDINRKFNNSSSLISLKHNINKLVNHYNQWQPGDNACIVKGYNVIYPKTKKVPNIVDLIQGI